MDTNSSYDIEKLPPEKEDGNCEYKRYLEGESKFIGYKTQLNRRMSQGYEDTGVEEAIYFLGFEDNGTISGMNINTINSSITYLTKMTESCDSKITDKKIKFSTKGVVAICKIERCHNSILPELRVMLMGDDDSGKTTLVSSLTHFKKDTGNGKSRVDSMRHTHEMISGETSSISTHLYGYTEKNDVIGYGNISYRSWNNISKKSKKLISLLDTPGNKKYIRTAIHSMFSSFPDLIFYVIDVKKCFFEQNMKKFLENMKQINQLVELEFNVMIILNKCDLIKIDIGYPKIIKMIKLTVKKNIYLIEKGFKVLKDKIPILFLSNVSHYGLDTFHQFILAQEFRIYKREGKDECTNFIITEVSKIPEMGIVIHGVLKNGEININDNLMVGPIKNEYESVKIKSIHKKQVPYYTLNKGEFGSLNIEIGDDSVLKSTINKSMSLVSTELLGSFHKRFQATLKKDDYKEIIKMKKSSASHIFFNNIVEIIQFNEEDKCEEKDNLITIGCRFRNKKTYHLINENTKGMIKVLNVLFVCEISQFS